MSKYDMIVIKLHKSLLRNSTISTTDYYKDLPVKSPEFIENCVIIRVSLCPNLKKLIEK